MSLTIAIDGPVGAGKSSISDAVAQKLHILHLDTGAMYRAYGYYAIQNGINTKDEAAVEAILDAVNIQVAYQDGKQQTILNGQNVSEAIRKPEVSLAASDVSKFKAVRKAMVHLQREIAKGQDILLDGRDIGTVVLKNASVKIFLTAKPEVRAQRRYLELKNKGSTDTYEMVLQQLIARDDQDMSREVDPLRPAEGAIEVDTSCLSFEQSVAKILSIVEAAQ